MVINHLVGMLIFVDRNAFERRGFGEGKRYVRQGPQWGTEKKVMPRYFSHRRSKGSVL